jgi:hypothetical protein
MHPASYPMGTGGSFPGVKAVGCEADHSPHLVPKSKNAWSCISTPQHIFMVWCLANHWDNFTFCLLPVTSLAIRTKISSFLFSCIQFWPIKVFIYHKLLAYQNPCLCKSIYISTGMSCLFSSGEHGSRTNTSAYPNESQFLQLHNSETVFVL